MSYAKLWHDFVCVLPSIKREDGQALGEYALILTFIAMAAILALTALGLVLPGFWEPLLNVI
ncbi:MAG: Flp family type IVb pilin [Dehalococcoidia bacterium]|nr:MAG: Flp family type IVb pilin [Dehalococcoidia bacterium]